MDPYYSAGLKLIERGFKGKVSSCSVMQKKFPFIYVSHIFSKLLSLAIHHCIIIK